MSAHDSAASILPTGEQDPSPERRTLAGGRGRVLRSRLRRKSEVTPNMTTPTSQLREIQRDLIKQVRGRGAAEFGKLPAAEAALMKRARRHLPAIAGTRAATRE